MLKCVSWNGKFSGDPVINLELINVITSLFVTDYSNTGTVALNPEWNKINGSVASFENERTIFSECTKLHSSWQFAATSASFPVPKGESITVTCQEKYINVGAKIVSCIEQTEYSTAGNKIPTCLKPSKIKKASAFEVVLLQF